MRSGTRTCNSYTNVNAPRPSKIVDRDNHSTTFAHDSFGNVISTTDPVGVTTASISTRPRTPSWRASAVPWITTSTCRIPSSTTCMRACPSPRPPRGLLLTDEIRDTVNRAIENLPDDLRTAIVLRELEGLSYEDIAQTMDCPVGTVRSRIFRAREATDKKTSDPFSKGALVGQRTHKPTDFVSKSPLFSTASCPVRKPSCC